MTHPYAPGNWYEWADDHALGPADQQPANHHHRRPMTTTTNELAGTKRMTARLWHWLADRIIPDRAVRFRDSYMVIDGREITWPVTAQPIERRRL